MKVNIPQVCEFRICLLNLSLPYNYIDIIFELGHMNILVSNIRDLTIT